MLIVALDEMYKKLKIHAAINYANETNDDNDDYDEQIYARI